MRKEEMEEQFNKEAPTKMQAVRIVNTRREESFWERLLERKREAHIESG